MRPNLILWVIIVFFLSLGNIFGYAIYDNETTRKGGYLSLVFQNKIAEAICIGDNPSEIDIVYFKGPSGKRVKAGIYRNDYSSDYIRYFEYIDENGNKCNIRKTTGIQHFQQGLPVPSITEINGNVVADYVDINDNGVSDKNYSKRIEKIFQTLPNDFKKGLKEFYLFGGKSIGGITAITVSLESFFPDLIPYKVTWKRNLRNEAESMENIIAEFDDCTNSIVEKIELGQAIDHNIYKLYKLNINLKQLYILSKKKKKEDFFFRSSKGKWVMINLIKNKFPVNFIRFEYKEEGQTYLIDKIIYNNFFKNTLGVPFVQRFNSFYIAGILSGKNHESSSHKEIEKEFNKLPMTLQKSLQEFWVYCISPLCKTEMLNPNYSIFFKTSFNKKQLCNKMELIDSSILRNKMIDEVQLIYGIKQ